MTAKLNRVARCAAAVLAVVAVGAGAAACDSSSGPAASKADAQSGSTAQGSSDSKSGAQSGSQDTAQGGTDDKAQSTSTRPDSPTAQNASRHDTVSTAQKGSRTDAVNPASAATSSRCHTSGLRFTWSAGAPDMRDEADAQTAMITLKNTSAHTCTLHGFPGLRLISTTGTAWDLRRSSDTPSTITLHPGDDTAAVSFNLLAVPATAKDTKPFIPSKVQITPPNETTHATLSWPYGGAILDQSGATHPGTFVNPVGY
ncbi:DUF4232 domain-containing protein [Streptomyces sp. NBC_00859]|uniref:DUF4232 domain-containing protein n=1 Tax=Streptomyces sp. NBC_00859 TaxID=2903682 RepID=UPI00386BDE59|nr:DUF4232 domain-containing protein [Streptomyces sp. NBC_00859]